MKAVMSPVPQHILEWRKRTGADRFDEMWEEALHMVPIPTGEHQDLVWHLETYLRLRWAAPRRAKVRSMNVAPPGGWPGDFRAPDWILWTSDRDSMYRSTRFEGPRNVAIEVSSPDDEPCEKLTFYARLGVPEVWTIHRDTRKADIPVLKRGQYELKAPPADGWLTTGATGVQVRATGAARLSLRTGKDDSTQEEIPRD